MTSRSDIAFASAEALVDLYRSKALSPVEAAQALFQRFDALQPRLNAFCIVDRAGGLAAGREAGRRWHRAGPVGPVHGGPATIKDPVLLRRLPTRHSSS